MMRDSVDNTINPDDVAESLESGKLVVDFTKRSKSLDDLLSKELTKLHSEFHDLPSKLKFLQSHISSLKSASESTLAEYSSILNNGVSPDTAMNLITDAILMRDLTILLHKMTSILIVEAQDED